MPYAINWNLLGAAPDIGQRFQEGYQQGRAQGAMRALVQDPDNRQAFADLASSAPQTAISYAVNRRQQQQADRDQSDWDRRRQALDMAPDVLAGYGFGSAATASSAPGALAPFSTPAASGVLGDMVRSQPTPGGGPALPPPHRQDPSALSSLLPDQGQSAPIGGDVVTAPVRHHTIADLYALDPDVASSMVKQVGQMQDQHRTQLASEAEALGTAAYQLLNVPAAQRQDAIERMRPTLLSAGFGQHEIDSADLSDDGLHGYVTHALGLKAAMAQHQQEAEADEKAQHDRAMEANAAGDLAVSRGHLTVAQQREARERIKGGGGGGGSDSSASSAPIISRNVGGRTYYQVGGRWFDNAEGR